jgi:phosphatidylglycerophosphatase A
MNRSANNPGPRQVFTDPVLWLAFGFGSGLAPKAPGTAGTLVAVPLLWLGLHLSAPMFALVTLAIAVIGIPICGLASRRLGVHDHGGIVWDEFAGLFVTALPVAFGWCPAAHELLILALAFLWFRLFDIWKPWPIRVLDKNVHGGLGIMVDDLLAGVFAAAALWASLILLA